MKIVDLFCGMGSFHTSAKELDMECVFACDIDPVVRHVYEHNYGMKPHGDITCVNMTDIPDHDILCGGFPCQPFSQIGQRKGRNDTRGCLIDYIVAIMRNKRPKACILENVKGLLSSNGGRDFRNMVAMIEEVGYRVHHKVLRADDYGIPQMRQRLFVVCLRDAIGDYKFPSPLESCPSLAVYMGMPFTKKSAFTIRCGGRHSNITDRRNWDSYYLDDGSVYTLTTKDCLKLQGFNEFTWNWGEVSETRRMRMLGNTIPTCLTKAVLESVQHHLCQHEEESRQD